MSAEIKTEYRPECEECVWIGKRTSDYWFAIKQRITHNNENHVEELALKAF